MVLMVWGFEMLALMAGTPATLSCRRFVALACLMVVVISPRMAGEMELWILLWTWAKLGNATSKVLISRVFFMNDNPISVKF